MVTDQWAESIHADWRRLWERSYRVKDVDCDEFGRQLHRCVSAINAQHTPYSAQAIDDVDSFGRGARYEHTNPGGVHEGPEKVRSIVVCACACVCVSACACVCVRVCVFVHDMGYMCHQFLYLPPFL